MSRTIATFATIIFAGLSINAASAAVPQTGRIDFSEHAGIERPTQVIYDNGRVDQGATKGIYRHSGRNVTNGRQR